MHVTVILTHHNTFETSAVPDDDYKNSAAHMYAQWHWLRISEWANICTHRVYTMLKQT